MKTSGTLGLLASILALVAMVGPGCSSSNSESCAGCDAGTPIPAFVGPYGSCDVMQGYAVAAAADCPGFSCPGGKYYAICSGTQWVECSCEQPDSGTLIPDPNFSGVPCDGCDAGTDSPSGYDAPELDTGSDVAIVADAHEGG